MKEVYNCMNADSPLKWDTLLGTLGRISNKVNQSKLHPWAKAGLQPIF